MRILYDHQLFSLQDAGGASRYFYELMKALAGVDGVEPELWSELWMGFNQTVYPFRQLSGGRTRVVGWGGWLQHGRCRYLANEMLGNVLASCAGRFDVYHPTLYRQMPLVRTRRMVVTHHDCAVERFPELFSNAKKIIGFKRRQYAEADAIICVSESSRRDLLQFYNVGAKKARVIYHGLEPLAGSAAAAAELRRLVPSEFLLFVGSRAPYKNFNNLLRAFRATRLHESLLLVAAGGGYVTPEEWSLAEELEIADRVLVWPQVRDALLAEAYKAAKLLVYPSFCEGFGFPPLEAMAANCPVLVCNTSCLPEICRDAAFYFNPGDQGSLEAALFRAVTSEEPRQRARARGSRIAAGFSWQKCADETLALYRACQ